MIGELATYTTFLARVGVHAQIARLQGEPGGRSDPDPSKSNQSASNHSEQEQAEHGRSDDGRSGHGRFERGTMVVCRTNRGIELGEVLAEATLATDANTEVEFDGTILRRAAAEELYLQGELKKLADQFLVEAAQAIQQVDSQAILLEVEPMLDCQTVYFHFLGMPPDALHEMMDELAVRFQRTVQNSRLAELLDKGCGPGCGTKDHGCSSSGCKGCAVAQACGSKKRA